MKKKIFTIIAGLTVAAPAVAQHSYFKVGAGFHFPVMQQEMPYSNLRQKEGTFSYEESVAKYSLHRGVAPTVSFGHMFNEHIGFELGVNYLIATENKAWQGVRVGGEVIFNELVSKASNVNFYPALRLAAPLGKYISVYTRVGLVVPIVSKIKDKFTSEGYDSLGEFHRVNITSETKNRFTIGFAGAAGLHIKLSKHTAFFAEINAQMLNVWAKSAERTYYAIDGKDQLAGLRIFEREMIYKKKLDTVHNTGAVPNKPSEGLTYQSPFHSAGLNVGLSFSL